LRHGDNLNRQALGSIDDEIGADRPKQDWVSTRERLKRTEKPFQPGVGGVNAIGGDDAASVLRM
jgi:hypothetical protein